MHNALIKGALQPANKILKKTRGWSLRSLEENLTLKLNQVRLGSFALLIFFFPFGQQICSVPLIKVEEKSA